MRDISRSGDQAVSGPVSTIRAHSGEVSPCGSLPSAATPFSGASAALAWNLPCFSALPFRAAPRLSAKVLSPCWETGGPTLLLTDSSDESAPSCSHLPLRTAHGY